MTGHRLQAVLNDHILSHHLGMQTHANPTHISSMHENYIQNRVLLNGVKPPCQLIMLRLRSERIDVEIIWSGSYLIVIEKD